MITETGLPKGKTYTLTMPRFGMTKSDYGDFYEEDGITYLPAVLTIDFPESYQAGDFIKIDQWYDIQPISFHLLGVEILHIDDEGLVRFRLVMQSPPNRRMRSLGSISASISLLRAAVVAVAVVSVAKNALRPMN